MIKHGRHGTPEYRSWRAMLNRCYDTRHKGYHNYGGRGITVYPGWRKNFAAFFAHVGLRPSPRHQLDRIMNDVGYAPGNVKWSLPRENINNRRNTVFVDGVPLADLARRYGVSHSALTKRLIYGWNLEYALTAPPGAKRPEGAWR